MNREVQKIQYIENVTVAATDSVTHTRERQDQAECGMTPSRWPTARSTFG